MSNKVKNPMKVITGPNTRWSYCNVWQPKSINGGTPKYSVSLIIPKSDTVTINKIRAAIEAVFDETGKVQPLLDQHHRIFTGFLCVLHQFQHIGRIVQGALFHLFVVKGKVLRWVSGIHAKRLF